jgi:hypothetical protein
MTVTSAIQKRVYEILSAGMDQPIYDYVPPDAVCPYIEIGDDIVTDLSDKTGDQFAVSLTIHCWSTSRGRKEIRDMTMAVRELLHNIDLAIDDLQAVSRCTQMQTFRDPDGFTQHGTATFRIMV